MLIHLNNRALLKITGSESESFLQSQLSNDINKLDNSSVQLNAYCQHQGKILALFWVMRSGNDFLISFPINLLDSIKDHLANEWEDKQVINGFQSSEDVQKNSIVDGKICIVSTEWIEKHPEIKNTIQKL